MRLIQLLDELNFNSVNTMLTISVILNIVGYVLGLIAPHSDSFGMFSIITMIVLGVLMVFIGVNFQKCSNDLHGHLKLFSLTWIISGVCLASIILIPFFILTWVAMNVILGMIFFKEADRRQDLPIF